MCTCDYDGPAVYSEAQPKARKAHTCCECGLTIQPGEHYHTASGCWDGEWSYHKTCRSCHVWRASLDCWAFGRLAEDLAEHFHQYTDNAGTPHYFARAWVEQRT